MIFKTTKGSGCEPEGVCFRRTLLNKLKLLYFFLKMTEGEPLLQNQLACWFQSRVYSSLPPSLISDCTCPSLSFTDWVTSELVRNSHKCDFKISRAINIYKYLEVCSYRVVPNLWFKIRIIWRINILKNTDVWVPFSLPDFCLNWSWVEPRSLIF